MKRKTVISYFFTFAVGLPCIYLLYLSNFNAKAFNETSGIFDTQSTDKDAIFARYTGVAILESKPVRIAKSRINKNFVVPEQFGNQSVQIRDKEGNFYPTVKIGSQIWMAENLNVGIFRNGDPIPQAKTDDEWFEAGNNEKPAWCYYENNELHGKKYGKLYNWWAVNDSRGLAPQGWKVPTDADWTILETTVGSNAVNKLKSKSGWDDNLYGGGNGTNATGFNALPGGYRMFVVSFSHLEYAAFWWSATESENRFAYSRELGDSTIGLGRESSPAWQGFSVRCIKD